MKGDEQMPSMNDADAALLEKLVESGFDPGVVEGLDDAQQARLQRLAELLGMLDGYPSEPLDESERETLVHATLARIDRFESEQADRMTFSNAGTGGGRGRFGPLELVAVAAILIIGVAVIFPIMNAGKRTAMQQHSSQNLAMIGQGLFDYSNSNNDTLPSTPVEQFSPVFGEAPERLDLQPLVQSGLLDARTLGNPGDSTGFSYQTQPAHHEFISLHAPVSSILLGDSNPTLEHISIITIDEARKSLRIQSQTTISWSPNVLFTDGHSERLPSYYYGDDDLRLPAENWHELGQPDAFLTH